ncbi:Fur family transcriptional regulator, ferric uptake regulator [Lampropedia hyalina DSM 16112]|jgi:Fur family ferric uptake transcriptional regulator|uniref:Ferric uptake regulation protein n=2 Tax=Lampropedia TaxID=198705 RepID=A0A1M5BUA0_9BURK|nr:Fur family transcriptional regulator, ferric uptake regulator [Lampropedia hyalina DSM 16112]
MQTLQKIPYGHPMKENRKSHTASTHSQHQESVQILKNIGIHITLPRLKLLDIIHQSDKALTAQEIYTIQVNQGVETQLSTIYVNLKKLEQYGVITRIRLDDEPRSFYCLSAENQSCRIICSHCKKLSWPQHSSIESHIQTICQDNGFKMNQFSLVIEGICKACEHLPRHKTPAKPSSVNVHS